MLKEDALVRLVSRIPPKLQLSQPIMETFTSASYKDLARGEIAE